MTNEIFKIKKDESGNRTITLFGREHLIKKQFFASTIILATCLGLLVIVGTAAVIYNYTKPNDSVVTNTNTNEKSKKKQTKKNTNTAPVVQTVARRLDGMPVSAEDANKTPECVMIENAAFGGVRPQSGLSRALVVYEVVVEGGITRFMAVFGGEQSNRVGPVRSARDTYLEFASELNCSYFHAGGSDTALAALYNKRMRHVDGLIESKYFWRDYGFIAPHNLFTSTDNLDQATANHNWTNEGAPTYTSWTFQAAVDAAKRADASTDTGVSGIHIAFGGSYNVDYAYNSANNYFERTNGGVLQTDAVNNEVISAKNVIIMHVGEGVYIEGKGRVNWPVTGSGAVDIFHDGQVYSGTWTKADRTSRTLFTDSSGNPIPLVQGNSWVEVVPNSIPFNYE